MRDHDDRPATHGRRERLDKRRFVFRVSKRRRLIEHQDGAILQKRPGDSKRCRWPPERNTPRSPTRVL